MDAGDKEILADFKRASDKTIELLQAVPAKLLKKQADGEDENLAKLFHHIAATINGWMMKCMEDGGPPPPAFKSDKATLAKHLKAAQARVLKFFRAKAGKTMSAVYRPKRGGKTYRFVGRGRVLYLTQHEVHHRGKIVLALRQWGFTKIPFMPYW